MVSWQPADDFVNKFQQNEFLSQGIDFNKFSLFYCTKLKNILSYIAKGQEDKNMSIAGIHGWYFFESVLYGLFWDEFPTERNGQIKMWEEAILQFIEIPSNDWEENEVWISFHYRGVEKTISQKELNIKINNLRSNIQSKQSSS